MCKIRGSVPLRPGENIRKFESQNFVHCLVSMCSSMYYSYMKKLPMFKNEYLSSCDLSFRVGWGCVYIEIP